MLRAFLGTLQDADETRQIVRARGYTHAAQILARTFYGRLQGLRALRTTGDPEQSGDYRAYLPCPTGGLNSHGVAFHVREV